MNPTLTALTGVRVGHGTNLEALTGATVIQFDRPVRVGVRCYGGSPGTFNTDPFDAGRNHGRTADAIFISGGSYQGLTSGAEIMRGMIERGTGSRLFSFVNPALTGAIVMDLGVRLGQFDPGLASAALDNLSAAPVVRGNVGAGTGTSVGKFYYPGGQIASMKAGVGCGRVDLPGGGIVTALSVVNALGNVVARDGTILAGNRGPSGGVMPFLSAPEFLAEISNTTISVVGTNVALPQGSDFSRVAHLASHGQVRAINPVNLEPDGDAVFVFSTEEVTDLVAPDAGLRVRGANWPQLVVDLVGQAAAEAVQESIYDACTNAETVTFNGALDGVIPAA